MSLLELYQVIRQAFEQQTVYVGTIHGADKPTIAIFIQNASIDITGKIKLEEQHGINTGLRSPVA